MNDIKTIYDAILKRCGSSTLFDIFGGQQPYYLMSDGELQVLVKLTADKIPELIKDGSQHDIYYKEQPTTYCASSFHGAIIMNDASEFSKGEDLDYWMYAQVS